MEVYRSEDMRVAKYVHDDGSETAIKAIQIQEFGGVYGAVNNKYNVFISTSVGCPVGCKFCYLTVKRCPYYKLSTDSIVGNVVSAIREELGVNKELYNMYTKLSWMGMGDAFLDLGLMSEVTIKVASILKEEGLSLGIDCVDISTTMPLVDYDCVDKLKSLSNTLNKGFNINPMRGRASVVRVFYSLHSSVNKTRVKLIPIGASVTVAMDILSHIKGSGISTTIHHMFFEGINDSEEEVSSVSKLLKGVGDTELRLLRFNKCPGTLYTESSKFDSIVEVLYKDHKNIKVQSSPGSEVKAACGQFLLSKVLSK
jgi:adenine C2-methylase RlmN of 23S rRNA A2503 and tRNA A37